MTLNYQRWTPPCGCSFEQEVNSETGEIKLLFAHGVCGGHVHIAEKSKSKIASPDRKEQIIKLKEQAWENNRNKNLEDFDNTEENKRIKSRVQKAIQIHGINNSQQDVNAQTLLQYHLDQKRKQEEAVDKFTNEKKIEMLIGLECPHSLNAQEVYETILKEQEEIAKANANNGQ